MTTSQAKKIITECVDSLPREDRRRLGLHAEKKTRIICGDSVANFRQWIDFSGGGTLAVLASTRRVPKKRGPSSVHWSIRQATLAGTNRKFNTAIKNIRENVLRRLLLTRYAR